MKAPFSTMPLTHSTAADNLPRGATSLVRLGLLLVVGCGTLTCPRVVRGEDDPAAKTRFFDDQVAPILLRRCLECHGGTDPKGELDLTRRDSALAGGESGIVLVPGSIEQSLLWDYVRDGIMPPSVSGGTSTRLTETELETLRRWIEEGLVWSEEPLDLFRFTTPARAGYDWWSLQPLLPVNPPEMSQHPQAAWIRNEIDAFVLQRLEAVGLTPAEEADRRRLIRRVTFDLIGLPPAPAEVEQFLADEDPQAYERLVERLLASPHYGERWARHWLDVARFGESQGFERDKLRENAWHYRDWVIRAFNEDLPYDDFMRMQIAGDLLMPDSIDGVIATGFLVAGPFDEVGQSQQSEVMKRVVRQDELEDIVGTVSQAFLGLTVHCARCHDHKFDPITQEEYYRLTAALGGVRHGERPVLTSFMREEIARLEQEYSDLARSINELEEPIRQAILAERQTPVDSAPRPQPVARWTFDENLDDELLGLTGTLHGAASLHDGRLLLDGTTAYVASSPLPVSIGEKTLEAWVSLSALDQRGGAVISLQTLDGNTFDAIVFGEQEPRRWMAGSENFRRTRSFGGPEEIAPEPAEEGRETNSAGDFVHVAIVYTSDGRITAYREGVPYGVDYLSDGPVLFPKGESQIVFGLRHGTSATNGRMLAGAIDQAHLYDRALSAEEVALSAGRGTFVSPSEVLARLSPAEIEFRQRARDRQAAIERDLNALKTLRVYAVTPRQPDVARLLHRGNPEDPREEVTPGGLSCISGVDAEFGLEAAAPEAEARQRLAEWLASPENPLPARVMANRLWHHHFGQGLVLSPSDFGFNGGHPSHPELLDYLARSLIDSGWSLKSLHRLIVTSATYRQASSPRESCLTVDAGNRWLWRYSPRRLEAEVLRDTLLSLAGELDARVGGPPYRDFNTFVFNSQFYEMLVETGPEQHRRTIYRTWVRSARSPFLDVFDCPDPSTTSPRRAVTTTPLQALSLMNNSFVLAMSESMADRVRRETPEGDQAAQVRLVMQLACSREPDPDELPLLVDFVVQHGLGALCRVVFNSNEFLHIE